MNNHQEQVVNRIIESYENEQRFYLIKVYGADVCVDDEDMLCLEEEDARIVVFTDLNRAKVVIDDIKDGKEEIDLEDLALSEFPEFEIVKTSIMDVTKYLSNPMCELDGAVLDFALFSDSHAGIGEDEVEW